MGEHEAPGPDPGNSPPEHWTQPLTDEELAEVRELLAQHQLERDTGATVIVEDDAQ